MSRQDNSQDESSEQRPSADRQKLARLTEANDVKAQMSTKQGRRFVWRLLDKAGVYRTSFTGNSETFFKEGMRNMGLFIVGEIHAHCPEAYAQMVAESKAGT